MKFFESETDLIRILDEYDNYVRRCALGELEFVEFVEIYGAFYSYYALDGHESDEAEFALLEKHEERIELHRIIAEEILAGVCSEEDMKNPLYPEAGRFGPDIALKKLRKLARDYFKLDGQQGGERRM